MSLEKTSKIAAIYFTLTHPLKTPDTAKQVIEAISVAKLPWFFVAIDRLRAVRLYKLGEAEEIGQGVRLTNE